MPRPCPYTPQIMQRHVEVERLTHREIAAMYNRSPRTIEAYCLAYGIRSQHRSGRHRKDKTDHGKVARLIEAGFRASVVAKMVNLSHNAVSQYCKRHGVEYPSDRKLIDMRTVRRDPDLVRRRFAEAMR